jgi:predicted transcriptional regulator
MTATVRLDKEHEKELNEMAALFHKKKSDMLREALDFYVDHILSEKRRRILAAVEKVDTSDAAENEAWEEALDDGLEG